MWWVSNDKHGAYAARGVHGQTIWVDPAADMVIVRFASNPVAANAASDPTSLPAYRAVAEYLMAHDKTPLLGQEWVIEDIAGAGVIDNSDAALFAQWPSGWQRYLQPHSGQLRDRGRQAAHSACWHHNDGLSASADEPGTQAAGSAAGNCKLPHRPDRCAGTHYGRRQDDSGPALPRPVTIVSRGRLCGRPQAQGSLRRWRLGLEVAIRRHCALPAAWLARLTDIAAQQDQPVV